MKHPPEMYDLFYALVNDKQRRVIAEEQADLFLDAAMQRVPFLAASLLGLSRGLTDMSERCAVWPGVLASKVKARNPRRKKANVD